MNVRSGPANYLMFVLFAQIFSFAQASEDTATESEHGAEHKHSFEHHGRHALGVFLGITHEDGDNRETIGIEYSYRINRYWSVGAAVERAEAAGAEPA